MIEHVRTQPNTHWVTTLIEKEGDASVLEVYAQVGAREWQLLQPTLAECRASLIPLQAIYVLVVIPGIYTYLRRKDQVLRLIVVVPACSVVITGAAYYFNSNGRGKELVVRELGLAWARGGQRQVVLNQTGVLFSPSPTNLSLALNPDTLLRPNSSVQSSNPTLLCQGDRLSLEAVAVPQWGISRWVGMGIRQLAQPISLGLKSKDAHWQVSLDNRSGLPPSKAVLLIDST